VQLAFRRFAFNRAGIVLAIDVVFAVTVAVVAWSVISAPQIVSRLDLATAHVIVMIVSALVAGGIAVLGAVGARTLRHPRPAWLGAAFGLAGLFAIPLAALDPPVLARSPGLVVTMVTADFASALLLIAAARPPLRVGTWVAGAAAVAGSVLAVALGVLAPQLRDAGHLLLLPVAATVAWGVAGALAMLVGWRDRDSATWRVGIGLFVIGLAHAYRVLSGQGPATAGLGFTVLQLIGGLAVLGGLARRLRAEVMVLTAQAERQRTELRQADERVRWATERADERDHELANGLAGLSGVAFLLDDPAARHDIPALRTAVVSELSRLHALVRPEADGRPPRDFDVADLVAEVALLHRGRGMDIQISTDGATGARGDRASVGQVLANLLVNCERHASGSAVRVHVRQHGERIAVLVSDDGLGAPVGAERALVGRGVVGPRSTGSGLGLHVSARLMAEQHGSLHVLPRRPDVRGFAVRLELPRSEWIRGA
jgi:two-component system, OmpR family, sensor kinase